MKRILALLLALIMVLSLVACATTETSIKGTAEASTAADGTSNSTSGDPESDASNASAGDEHDPVTIRVATFRYEDEDTYGEIINRFQEKYPWITVNFETNPDETSYEQNLRADILNGTTPDVFDVHQGGTFDSLIDDGVISPLDDLDFNANYQEGAAAITTQGNHNYGFLNAYNMISVFYNKDIFDAEGWTEPANFDEFVALCKEVREKGYGGFTYCGLTVGYAWMTRAQLAISCGNAGCKDLMDGLDSGKYVNPEDVPGATEALKGLAEYRDNNIFYDASEATDLSQSMALFAQGRAAMMICGTWIFGTKETDFPNINAGIFAIPTLTNSGKHYGEGAQLTVASASSENLDAAKLWIDFLASQEIASYYCSESKMVSTINGVGLDFEGGEILANAVACGVELLPAFTWNNEDYWYAQWQNCCTSLLFGDDSFEEAVGDLTAHLTEVNIAGQS